MSRSSTNNGPILIQLLNPRHMGPSIPRLPGLNPRTTSRLLSARSPSPSLSVVSSIQPASTDLWFPRNRFDWPFFFFLALKIDCVEEGVVVGNGRRQQVPSSSSTSSTSFRFEEEENMSPPFWLQASNSFRQSNHRSSRLGRSASSVFFSSGAFVFALIVIALVFIFFVIPSLLSFTSQIFRPHLVKKSWDSLNLVLVLFAIVCGFLSRNSGNDNNVSSPMSYDVSSPQKFEKSNPSTPRQWYDQYSDRSRTVDNQSSGATSTMDRGVRTSSSYPDLRQQEPSWNVVRDERWRSHDDTHVAGYRIPDSDPQHQLHRRHRSWHEEPAEVVAQEEPAEVLAQEEPAEVLAQEEPAEVQARVGCVLRTKNIPVNTFVIPAEQVSSSHAQIQVIQPDPLSSSHAQIQVIQSDPLSSSHAQIQVIQSYSPPPSPPRTKSPPPPPPPRKTKRTYQAIGEKENSNASDNLEVENNLPPPPLQAPPSPLLAPPSSPPQMSKEVENKKTPAGKHAKKKGVATTKEFLITSLRRSRKKQRQKSVENFDSAPSSLLPPPSLPPPPPPLPPPSVFHNLFSSKKSNKPKKTIHPIPQPPSPPPLPRINSTGRLSQIRPTMTTQKPLPPVKVTSFINRDDENANSGGESPSVGIPPPPPPPLPPFSIPVMKYAEHGDFVRIKSNDSSRSGSPDLDDSDQDLVPSPTMEAGSKTPSESGGSPTKAMFCPSPDVNTKADTFIARFRAGLKLEKMNSVRGRSNLGPHSSEEDVTDI